MSKPIYCCNDLQSIVDRRNLDLCSGNTYSQSGYKISTDYYFIEDGDKRINICPYCGVNIEKLEVD